MHMHAFTLSLSLTRLPLVSQGNKGGVSARLSFYGHMLCFLNCHLAAHMDFASQRVDELEYIVDTQTFHRQKAPKIDDHRSVGNLWRRGDGMFLI